MAEHTPGQWRVLEWADDKKGFIAIVAREQDHICDVFPFGKRLGGLERALDQHKANARLIAAAPDMLELLLDTRCPGGGWNGMSEEEAADPTVRRCMGALSCGCIYGSVVAKATKA